MSGAPPILNDKLGPRWPLSLTLAAAGGLLEFLAHPGLEYSWLGPVALLPLALVILNRSGVWVALATGFLTGAIAWTAALSWLPASLTDTTSSSQLVAVCLTALAVCVQALPYALGATCSAILLKRFRVHPLLSFPFGMLAGEALTPTFLPYSHGVHWLEFEFGRSMLAMVGRDIVAFCSFLLCISFALLLENALSKRRRIAVKSVGLAAVGVALAATALHTLRAPPAHSFPLDVALLQSSVDLEDKRLAPRKIFEQHLSQSRLLERQAPGPDLLIWGETMLSQPRTSAAQRRLLDSTLRTPVLSGAVLASSSCEGPSVNCTWTNGAVISAACGSSCTYQKSVLVPFSESNPRWAQELFQLPPGEFEAGDTSSVVEFRDHKLGISICYEAIFPGRARTAADENAEVWINLVSDRWVRSKTGRRAHEAFSRLSALERGLPLARLVDGGPSKVWDGQGSLLASLESGKAGTIRRRLPFTAKPSLFHLHETWIRAAFWVLLNLAAFVQGLGGFGRTQTRETSLA